MAPSIRGCWIALLVLGTGPIDLVGQDVQRGFLTETAFRNRKLNLRYRRARQAAQDRNVATAVAHLHAILDSNEEGLIADESGELRSVRSAALEVVRSLPERDQREFWNEEELRAERMIARWNERDGVISESPVSGTILREVSRRFFHTAIGFDASCQYASLLFDQGHVAFASEVWRFVLESQHASRLTLQQRMRAAAAFRREGETAAAREVLRGIRDIRLAGRRIPVGEWLQSIRPQVNRSFAWPVNLPNRTPKSEQTDSLPLPESRWHWEFGNADHVTNRIVASWIGNQRGLRPMTTANQSIVVGESVFYRDFWGLHCRHVDSGVVNWSFRPELSVQSLVGSAVQTDPSNVTRLMTELYARNSVMGLLSTDGRRLFAVDFSDVGSLIRRSKRRAARGEEPDPLTNELLAINLDGLDEERLAWQTGAVSGLDGHYFLGPPLPLAGQLYAITEKRGQLNLVALDSATGQLVWSQGIAFAQRPIGSGGTRHLRACPITHANRLLICPTQIGLLVAVDAVSGQIAWTYSYVDDDTLFELQGRKPVSSLNLGDAAFPDFPMVAASRVLSMPNQSRDVHCIDVSSGKPIWTVNRGDGLYIAGVSENTVVVVGKQEVRGLDLSSGATRWSTPIRYPSGRAILAAGRLLVPQSNRVVQLSAATGIAIGLPPQLNSLQPGNLLLANARCISTSADVLAVFDQSGPRLAKAQERLRRNVDDIGARLVAGEIEVALGHFERAKRHLRHVATGPDSPMAGARARRFLRLALYEQLARSPERANEFLGELAELSDEPLLRARFLMHRGEFEMLRGDVSAVLATINELWDVGSDQLVPLDGESYRLSCQAWVRGAIDRIARFDDVNHRELERHVESTIRRNAANDARRNLALIRAYAGWTAVEGLRRLEVQRAMEKGQMQRAELLLLSGVGSLGEVERRRGLVRLWALMGLSEEAARMVRGLSASDARQFTRNHPERSESINLAGERLRPIPWRVDRVSVTGGPAPTQHYEERSDISNYRRRMAGPPFGAFQLMSHNTSPGEMAVVDVVSGQIVRKFSVPSSFSTPLWNQRTGHFVPIASREGIHGLSVLPSSTLETEPIWEMRAKDVFPQPRVARIGPTGADFVALQCLDSVFVLDAVTGRRIWHRSGLPAVLSSHTASRFVGDGECLVIYSADFRQYMAFEVSTGKVIREGQLPTNPRQPRLTVGRHLAHIVGDDNGRLQLWDPLHDRVEIDLPAPARFHSSVSITESGQLALLGRGGQFLLITPGDPAKTVQIELPATRRGLVRRFQVFEDDTNVYVSIQHQRQIRTPIRESVTHVTNSQLDRLDVRGMLIAIDVQNERVRWQRDLPPTSLIRLRHLQLPFLVGLRRIGTRVNRPGVPRNSVEVEVIDVATGDTIGQCRGLLSERLLGADWDLSKGWLAIEGQRSRIELRFDRAIQRLATEPIL